MQIEGHLDRCLTGNETMEKHHKVKCFSILPLSPPPANKGCCTQKVKGFLLFKRLWSVWHTNGPQITSLQTRLGPSAWSARTCNAPSPWGLLTLLPFPFVFPLSLLLLPLPPILTPLPLPFAVFQTSEYRRVLSFGAPRGPEIQTEGENKEPLQCPRCRSYLALPLGRNA